MIPNMYKKSTFVHRKNWTKIQKNFKEVISEMWNYRGV